MPGYPYIKLWQDSADLLGISTQSLSRVRPSLAKYTLPVHSQFGDQPLRLEKIYIIEKSACTENKILFGVEKWNALIEHSYRFHFLAQMGLSVAYSKQLFQLSTKIVIERIGRLNLKADHG